jgi:hypothetical protein
MVMAVERRNMAAIVAACGRRVWVRAPILGAGASPGAHGPAGNFAGQE